MLAIRSVAIHAGDSMVNTGTSHGRAGGPFQRLGPRPLALHLSIAASSWMSAAVPLATAMAMQQGTDVGRAFCLSVDAAKERFDRLLTGVELYRRHPYRRIDDEPKPIYQSARLRLFDFGADCGERAVPVLIVPSVINRHYILDLMPERSFVRFLAERGFRPFLVGWGGGKDRSDMPESIDACISGELDAVLGVIRLRTEEKVVVAGYCLGGLLALALACRWPKHIRGLGFLATPWDFHSGSTDHATLVRLAEPWLDNVLALSGSVPVDCLQAMFAFQSPFAVIDKFLAFADADQSDEGARRFVALEDWANDGVPLPGDIARTLFYRWYRDNETARGCWQVDGDTVAPDRIQCPTLSIIPQKDRIVPPASAAALAEALPNSSRLTVATGHIGLMAGNNAPSAVWAPFSEWIESLA